MPPKRRSNKRRQMTFRELSELMIGPLTVRTYDGTPVRVLSHLSQFESDAERRDAWYRHSDEVRAVSRPGDTIWAETEYGAG